MSRNAIFDALVSDTALNDLGITADTVYQNYSLDQRPNGGGPFIIMRWESEDQPPFGRVAAPRTLYLWAHYPAEISDDFSKLDSILDAADDCLLALENTAGSDGQTVTCIRRMGRSGDNKDDGFHTISRNAGYEVLSRRDLEIE